MEVTSAQYKLSFEGEKDSIKAVIDGHAVQVPLNPDNRHYAAILEWVAEGNTIQDAD